MRNVSPKWTSCGVRASNRWPSVAGVPSLTAATSATVAASTVPRAVSMRPHRLSPGLLTVASTAEFSPSVAVAASDDAGAGSSSVQPGRIIDGLVNC